MASILFNNDSDSQKGKVPETSLSTTSLPTEVPKTDNPSVVQKEDDFAIFPQWDVVPPNAIINPRLKKNL